jgi:uncharacterized membrane protein
MKRNSRSWINFLMIALIVLGVFFRGVNLDRKVFWDDEAFTALRVSGYTGAQAHQALYTGQDLSFAEVEKYLSPNADNGIPAIVSGIAIEDPHLPPLYFVILKLWTTVFGGSLGVLRSFSAVVGILSIPAMYWLCMELFQSHFTAKIGTSLLAISPFFVVYSQEARNYSFWGLLVLVSSALLLRNLRRLTFWGWLLYSATVALGLYTHLFFTLVMAGQGFYVLVTERFKLTQRVVAYLVAAGVSTAAFIPWLLLLLSNAGRTEEMVYNSNIWRLRFSLTSMLSMWVGNVSRLFFDVGVGSGTSMKEILPLIPIIFACVALTLYALYFLSKSTDRSVWLFPWVLIAVPAVTYLASDVINGGRVSGVPRYYVPIFIGVLLAVAYTFSTLLTQSKDRQRNLWKSAFAIALTLGVISNVTSVPAKLWWNKGPENTRYIVEVSSIINQAQNPVVMTDDTLNRIAAMGHELKPTVSLRLIGKDQSPQLPPADSQLFVFRPSDDLRQRIETLAQRPLRPLPGTGDILYELGSPPSASQENPQKGAGQ